MLFGIPSSSTTSAHIRHDRKWGYGVMYSGAAGLNPYGVGVASTKVLVASSYLMWQVVVRMGYIMPFVVHSWNTTQHVVV